MAKPENFNPEGSKSVNLEIGGQLAPEDKRTLRMAVAQMAYYLESKNKQTRDPAVESRIRRLDAIFAKLQGKEDFTSEERQELNAVLGEYRTSMSPNVADLDALIKRFNE